MQIARVQQQDSVGGEWPAVMQLFAFDVVFVVTIIVSVACYFAKWPSVATVAALPVLSQIQKPGEKSKWQQHIAHNMLFLSVTHFDTF